MGPPAGALTSQNVASSVRNNTLNGRKTSDATELFDIFGEDIVSSGVAESLHLLQQGYTCINPRGPEPLTVGSGREGRPFSSFSPWSSS